jgi:hypothetical protein
MKSLYLLIFLVLLIPNTFGIKNVKSNTEFISLSGKWQFAIDADDKGINDKWFLSNFTDSIFLPGSMPENNKGFKIGLNTQWTGSIYDSSFYFDPKLEKYRKPDNFKIPFWLTPSKYYTGAAWYRKNIVIPKEWKNKKVFLYLERPHWETRIWIDDKEVGMIQNSLSTAHQYDLSYFLTPGNHVISIRVDNRIKEVNVGQNSHSITDHTQGNWNGIVGKIGLFAVNQVYIDEVIIYPDINEKKLKVSVIIKNDGKPIKGELLLTAEGYHLSDQKFSTVKQNIFISKTDTVQLIYPLTENVRLWDEFEPVLYKLYVKLNISGNTITEKTEVFGMRDFKTKGRQFIINDRPVILRGTVECCEFPLTGYPPTDENSWQHIFKICKEYGLNHMRFHSYCPPKAAFDAADKAGIYLQVEGPSWANQGTTIGDGNPIDSYLYEETKRIIKEYGNHPSFCMMAYGNEPKGRFYVEYLTKYVDYFKNYDNRRLYTGASIGMSAWKVIPNSQFIVRSGPRGLPWNKLPNSTFDYSSSDIVNWNVPYVAHEMGQWCVFPNFDEISKYTGVMKAHNFEMFQDILNSHHMGDQAHDFLMASGKLQALCYKYEIEASLRTPNAAGFQLLQLNDFSGQGTALVGILDVFWDNKGYITPDEFRMFCNVTVPLARIEKFVFKNNEQFTAKFEVTNYANKTLYNVKPEWEVRDENDSVVFSGVLNNIDIPIASAFYIGEINLSLSKISKAQKLTLWLRINEFRNKWDFWVYPEKLPVLNTKELYVCTKPDSIMEITLKNGGKVLLLGANNIENGKDIVQYLTPVFWNTSWFKMRPPHTTGILCQANHPALSDFPTEYHSNLQWWEILNRQQVMNIENFPSDFRPIIQPIDTWFLSRHLAMLFEANVLNGKIIVCSADLLNNLENRPVARQLLYSIEKYMLSEKFKPSYYLNIDVIKELFEMKKRKAWNDYTTDAPDELKIH